MLEWLLQVVPCPRWITEKTQITNCEWLWGLQGEACSQQEFLVNTGAGTLGEPFLLFLWMVVSPLWGENVLCFYQIWFPFQLPVGARTLPTTIMYVLSHMVYVLWYASVEYLLHQRTIIVKVTLRCEWKCTHHCCLLRVVSATIAEPKVHSNPEMGVCNETLY